MANLRCHKTNRRARMAPPHAFSTRAGAWSRQPSRSPPPLRTPKESSSRERRPGSPALGRWTGGPCRARAGAAFSFRSPRLVAHCARIRGLESGLFARDTGGARRTSFRRIRARQFVHCFEPAPTLDDFGCGAASRRARRGDGNAAAFIRLPIHVVKMESSARAAPIRGRAVCSTSRRSRRFAWGGFARCT